MTEIPIGNIPEGENPKDYTTTVQNKSVVVIKKVKIIRGCSACGCAGHTIRKCPYKPENWSHNKSLKKTNSVTFLLDAHSQRCDINSIVPTSSNFKFINLTEKNFEDECDVIHTSREEVDDDDNNFIPLEEEVEDDELQEENDNNNTDDDDEDDNDVDDIY